jgi:hypothetical protein
MLELAVVALIVAGAMAYALWALTPANTRLRLARKLAAWGGAQRRPAWVTRVVAAIERAAVKRQASACGACSAGPPKEPKGHQQPKR